MSATPSSQELERRFPRRLLLAGAGAATVAAVDALASPASAAPVTDPWKLGGNAGIATDGTNFLGPTNAAPLIFKTRSSATRPILERMRITPVGTVGIGVTSPAAALDVKSATTATAAIHALNNNSSSSATAVVGVCDAGTGVTGTSANYTGVQGTGNYSGVTATGQSYGVIATASAGASTGIYASGSTYGLTGYGSSDGVYGSGSGNGVHGESGANGVYGHGNTGVSGHGGAIGVFGGDASNSGVRGDSTYVGVWGTGTSWGIFGLATGTTGQNYGVYGSTDSASGFGLFSSGNAHVNGTLSKTAGSFKIDHPLDPERKWLSHSFVESPDMMNVYNGNVTLDANGAATVELPAYFAALNRDYRYQLTAIGAAAPSLHIAREVKDNAFAIAGGAPGGAVSWQVTGVRQDAYAVAHPIVVEEDKAAHEHGTRSFVPQGSRARKWGQHPQGVTLPQRQDAHPAPARPRAH